MSSNNNTNTVGSALADKDANAEMMQVQNGGAEGKVEDTKSMEYHRQVLAEKMAAGGQGGGELYVSPSDGIMSPCSTKLSAYKNKQFNKVKPQSLFAKTQNKNLFGGNKPSNGPMFGDKPTATESN